MAVHINPQIRIPFEQITFDAGILGSNPIHYLDFPLFNNVLGMHGKFAVLSPTVLILKTYPTFPQT